MYSLLVSLTLLGDSLPPMNPCDVGQRVSELASRMAVTLRTSRPPVLSAYDLQVGADTGISAVTDAATCRKALAVVNSYYETLKRPAAVTLAVIRVGRSRVVVQAVRDSAARVERLGPYRFVLDSAFTLRKVLAEPDDVR
jgi:hypothetical protein